jgi:hypothetical protein
MAQKNGKQPEVAVIVDDRGRFQGQFGGSDAAREAESFLRDVQKGGVKHLRGASIVTGEKALEAIKKGQI